jgi:glycosyltransferase involved in cell wall biosynthesis
MTKISVVIPVKNEEDKILSCLDAVFNQTHRPFEVIVVDGHSTDMTVKNANHYPIRLFYESYGTVGGARQVGVENANGDYIAFTDADCIPDINWLENLIKEFNDNKIIGVGGGIKNIGEGIWEESIALVLDSFLGSADSVQDRVFAKKKFVKSISGCNSIYRRNDLLDYNGFNINLSINEDTELNKRLIKHGVILYTPDAIVLHNQKRGLRDFAKRIYHFGFGRSNNRLWDLQAIPPILGLIALSFLFLSFNYFLFLISLYITMLLYFDIIIFLKIRKPQYIFSIPIVFIIEHISYSIGFWKGIVQFKKGSL